jgi:quercetin dioxygenase-like cupin family protein
MSVVEAARRRAIVMQPGEGPSFWQPVPANGFSESKLIPQNTNFPELSMGFQTIAPGGRVREHSHQSQVELQICFRGKGRTVIDGVSHDLNPGTACFLGYDVKHEIVNDSAEDLVMMWVISPAGLEDFFASIGRPRTAGQPTPEPFARPTGIIALERSLGMNDTKVT